MKVISVDLKKDLTEAILTAVEILKRGGTIVYPTDTIYGLGTNACDSKAVEQIFKIKNRLLTKPLPIIAKNLAWVRELAFVPLQWERVLSQIWPGAVTVILPKRYSVPSIVTANNPTVGIRIPDFTFTEKLLGKFGYPLTATSANLSGEEGSGNINKIISVFKNQIWKPDLVIDAGVLPRSLPSTILDLSTIKPKFLRVGPTKPIELMKILGIDKAPS